MRSASALAVNLAVLSGTLSRPSELRTLPSGDVVLDLQVTIRTAEATDSVPVSWPDPPPTACAWPAGQEVVVVGRVRRRFFRAGGTTASRTEVVASKVVPATRSRAVRRAIRAAVGTVDPLAP